MCQEFFGQQNKKVNLYILQHICCQCYNTDAVHIIHIYNTSYCWNRKKPTKSGLLLILTESYKNKLLIQIIEAWMYSIFMWTCVLLCQIKSSATQDTLSDCLTVHQLQATLSPLSGTDSSLNSPPAALKESRRGTSLSPPLSVRGVGTLLAGSDIESVFVFAVWQQFRRDATPALILAWPCCAHWRAATGASASCWFFDLL